MECGVSLCVLPYGLWALPYSLWVGRNTLDSRHVADHLHVGLFQHYQHG